MTPLPPPQGHARGQVLSVPSTPPEAEDSAVIFARVNSTWHLWHHIMSSESKSITWMFGGQANVCVLVAREAGKISWGFCLVKVRTFSKYRRGSGWAQTWPPQSLLNNVSEGPDGPDSGADRGDEEEKMYLKDSEKAESLKIHNRLGVKHEQEGRI